MDKLIINLIKLYRKMSANFPKMCRYYPTCSEYMILAIEKYGAINGIFIGMKRILRCNHLFEGGFDPVK